MSHSLLSALRYARTDAKRNNNYLNLGKSSAGQFLLDPTQQDDGKSARLHTSVENLFFLLPFTAASRTNNKS